MTSQLRSPNELFEKAKEVMLDGAVPKTQEDWCLVVNFWAKNIAYGLEESACILLAQIFEAPLHADLVAEIAKFQMEKKREVT